MESEEFAQPLGSVLVVGGCGFLGHHVVKQIISLKLPQTRVSVLDISIDRYRMASVSYYRGDITSSEDVRRVYQETTPQVIIHTVSPVVDSHNAASYHRVNVLGTRVLLDEAQHMGFTKAFVYTSSMSVIHNGYADLVMADESMPVLLGSAQPNLYNLSKSIAENLVLDANRKHGNMTTCAIRPTSMVGEGDVQLLPALLRAYEEGKTKFQLGKNRNLFDFVSVRNAAHAHILAAQKLVSSSTTERLIGEDKVDGEAFLITNDEPYFFWDFTHAVWAAAGDKTKPEEIWVIPVRLGLFIAGFVELIFWILFWGSREPNLTRLKIRYSAMTRTFNIQKAKSRLGYKPVVSMAEAIKEGVEWYQSNRTLAKKDQ